MNAEVATDVIEGEVVEGALVEVDAALVPYIDNQAALEAMIRKLSAFASTAAVLTVITPETKAHAVKVMRGWKVDRAAVIEFFKPIKQSIDRVKQMALNAEKFTLALIDGPVAVLTGRVVAYDRDVARDAEERRQRVLAAERARLEAEAEAARVDRERVQREADEAAALLAGILGDVAPEPTPAAAAPVISDELVELAALESEPPPEPEKVAGFNYTPVTHFAVDDFAALVAAVAAGTVPLDALQPNESHIRQQAGKMGVDLGYAGVRVWTTQDPRVRR